MPRSVLSLDIRHSSDDENDEQPPRPTTNPSSPTGLRRHFQSSTSFSSLRRHDPPRQPDMEEEDVDEESPLLLSTDRLTRQYTRSTPTTPKSRAISRQHSITGSLRRPKYSSQAPSYAMRIASAPTTAARESVRRTRTMQSLAASLFQDDRVWYDQFTSTDWVHDSIADGFRVRDLQKRKDVRGKLWLWFDSAQGWILVAFIGFATAFIAYFVDISESAIFDIKEGYCQQDWRYSRRVCCPKGAHCEDWRTWSQVIRPSGVETRWIDFGAFVVGCVTLALLSCGLTLLSKTVVPSHIASTLDENLGAPKTPRNTDEAKDMIQDLSLGEGQSPSITYYSAAGSGVAEVRVILSGFVLHGYLGIKTLVLKTAGLILSVASGMSLGKEGPYVHIATCIGNIACRPFSKYNTNDAKRREVLSAAAASGVAVAFGAPIGGVLFSLEEVSYYFPPKTLFRTFFCCIVAALSLKFFNPYGTSKIVIFEVRYITDWRFFELFNFVFLGVVGGITGALFIKASRFWATTFRRIEAIKKNPLLEVGLVALVTGFASFWNRYTKLPVTELLLELASPCNKGTNTGLCPTAEEVPHIIRYLVVAFIIKSALTIVTFGIKVPAGIYVPSMVVGGLMGRIVGHITQYFVIRYPDSIIFANCPKDGGVYALVAAGSTMCGVTRLSVTLAVILFELTGSLDHVLPFSLAVLCAKWTADAVEPLSIYDLLTDMNSYPFLDNKVHPVFDTELGDITRKTKRNRIIDISLSPLVRAIDLREKLINVQASGELDGGLPIVRDQILVGLIPAPDLEFALDQLDDEATAICILVNSERNRSWNQSFDEESLDSAIGDGGDPTDLMPYIEVSPIALDIHSPMDLVYQCFVKLGLRYICVLREGTFVGMVHKKAFVHYVKETEEEKRLKA